MSSMPPPLDNIYILIAVILGLGLLGFALARSRAASRRLETARKDKARVIREAKLRAQQGEADG